MNMDNLIRTVASNTGFTIKDCTPIVKETFNSIIKSVLTGEDVKLTGFGTFTTTVRKSHYGADPITHEKMLIPETKNMKFTQSEMIKKAFRNI